MEPIKAFDYVVYGFDESLVNYTNDSMIVNHLRGNQSWVLDETTKRVLGFSHDPMDEVGSKSKFIRVAERDSEDPEPFAGLCMDSDAVYVSSGYFEDPVYRIDCSETMNDMDEDELKDYCKRIAKDLGRCYLVLSGVYYAPGDAYVFFFDPEQDAIERKDIPVFKAIDVYEIGRTEQRLLHGRVLCETLEKAGLDINLTGVLNLLMYLNPEFTCTFACSGDARYMINVHPVEEEISFKRRRTEEQI